jgi:hypothetical protein
MSTIDLDKLKHKLDKSNILILEYYLIEDKCAMIKAYMYDINQFLIIYIPTKIRSEIKIKKDVYELKTLDDVLDEEEYANYDELNINYVNDKEIDSYKKLSEKYNKKISLNGDGTEKYEKRITRQIKRLNIPFSKLDYTIGIQNKKILALKFEEINLFYIKNFSKDIKCYMYIINIKDLIDNITDVHYEIDNINRQFYKIISDIMETNLTELKYQMYIEKYKKKNLEYFNYKDSFKLIINKINDEEKNESKKYKNLFLSETSQIRKNTLENEYEKLIMSIFNKKMENIYSMIDKTYIFQIFFLLLEEISFDNFIMIKRTELNFDKLKALFE